MPVRFGHVVRPSARQVLQYEPGMPLFVVVGTDRSFDREVTLHWLPGLKRGVPCTEEDCPWCPLPTRQTCYVPVLAYFPKQQRWREKVIYLTERMMEFLDEEREGLIWEFCRGPKPNSKVVWRRYDRENYRQPFAGFDVEESLWKIWNMYADARRNQNQPGTEAPTLFDPVREEREAV